MLADTLFVVGALLKLIFALQLLWLAIQGLTIIIGIFTAGLDALVAEGPAAAVIQAVRTAVTTILEALAQAVGKLLLRAVIGGAVGGTAGLGVGIYTVESKHLSGWDAVLTIGGDTVGGAGAGAMIATNPIALAGTGVGLTQIGVQAAVGGPTDFELGTQQWVQQRFGDQLILGGLLEDAVTPPTDLQSDFNTLVADTLVIGGIDEALKASDDEVQALRAKNDQSRFKNPINKSPVSTDANMPPGVNNPIGRDLISKIRNEGVRVEWNNQAQTTLRDANARGALDNRNPVHVGASGGNPDYAVVLLSPDATPATVYEEYLHVLKAEGRQWADLPPLGSAGSAGEIARWSEEIEVEYQVLAKAEELHMTSEQFDRISRIRQDNYLRPLKALYQRRGWKWPPKRLAPFVNDPPKPPTLP